MPNEIVTTLIWSMLFCGGALSGALGLFAKKGKSLFFFCCGILCASGCIAALLFGVGTAEVLTAVLCVLAILILLYVWKERGK